MISLTIQDSEDSMTFTTPLSAPIVLTSIINEADVETVDGNISTYYGSTKRQYTFKIAWLDAETYGSLQAFRDRQYSNLKYPRITVDGAPNLNVTDMTAKLTLNDQEVTNNCGLVENITLAFRESKQMP